MNDLSAYLPLLPEMVIAGTGLLLIFLLPWTRRGESAAARHAIPGLGLLALLLAALLLFLQIDASQVLNASSSFSSDTLAIAFRLLFIAILLLYLLSSWDYLRREQVNHGEYYCLLLFIYLGMALMALSRDLFLTFVGLELLSIGSYV